MDIKALENYLLNKYTSRMEKIVAKIIVGLLVTTISFLIWFIWKIKISLFFGCIGIAILFIGFLNYFCIRSEIKSDINKFKNF